MPRGAPEGAACMRSAANSRTKGTPEENRAVATSAASAHTRSTKARRPSPSNSRAAHTQTWRVPSRRDHLSSRAMNCGSPIPRRVLVVAVAPCVQAAQVASSNRPPSTPACRRSAHPAGEAELSVRVVPETSTRGGNWRLGYPLARLTTCAVLRPLRARGQYQRGTGDLKFWVVCSDLPDRGPPHTL